VGIDNISNCYCETNEIMNPNAYCSANTKKQVT
jgi:hypothetical protein